LLASGMGFGRVISVEPSEFDPPSGATVFFAGNISGFFWPHLAARIAESIRCRRGPVTILLADASAEMIAQTAACLMGHREFEHIASGVAPYFLDTALPSYYECFVSRQG
jgi:hypothetical protein